MTDEAWGRLYNRLESENLIPEQPVKNKKKFIRPVIFRYAASLILLYVCAITIWLLRNNGETSANMMMLSNENNSPTLVSGFEDGSVVYLTEGTTVHYPEHFTDNKRQVTLNGDAFFEITKNQEQPFYVDTDVATIKVLGTSFYVLSRSNSAFALQVRSGEVQITLKENGQSMNIRAGEMAKLESGHLLKSNNEEGTFADLFKLVHFKDESLSNVIRMINMNSRDIKLQITPEIADRRLNLTFSGDNPVAIAELICLALDLNYIQKDNIIHISQKNE